MEFLALLWTRFSTDTLTGISCWCPPSAFWMVSAWTSFSQSSDGKTWRPNERNAYVTSMSGTWIQRIRHATTHSMFITSQWCFSMNCGAGHSLANVVTANEKPLYHSTLLFLLSFITPLVTPLVKVIQAGRCDWMVILSLIYRRSCLCEISFVSLSCRRSL